MRFHILPLALLFCLSACYPTQLLLTPDSETAYWNHGKPGITKSTSDNIEVTMEFVERTGHSISYFLNITHYGEDPITLDPTRIFYTAPTTTHYNVPKVIYAHDPELQLQRLKRAQRWNAVGQGLVATAQVANAVADISKDVTASKREESPEERFQRKEDALVRHQALNATAIALEDAAYYQAQEYSHNAHSLFRKTTVFPNTTYNGIITFPYVPGEGETTYYIPVGDVVIGFTFRQSLH